MTQRIFDTDSEEDMALLWSILPDRVFKIHTSEKHTYYSDGDETQYFDVSDLIAFNWHDKTEITRPIKEATKADIGKLCVFSLKESTHEIRGGFGILTKINKDEEGQILYLKDMEMWYNSCRRLTKTEIEGLC